MCDAFPCSRRLQPGVFGADEIGAPALLVVNNANTVIHRNQVLALAAKSHLAALYEYRDWTEAGGLMSYGPVISETWRQLAECVGKILKGAKPADVPVRQPSKFDLRHQPQDRQGAWADDPAVTPTAGRSGDRVKTPQSPTPAHSSARRRREPLFS